jgi:hypothetical protein
VDVLSLVSMAGVVNFNTADYGGAVVECEVKEIRTEQRLGRQ